MAEIVIGRTLDRLKIKIVRASIQAFALAWMNGASPADISTYTFTIVLDTTPTTTWTATKSTNNTTWTLDATTSNLEPGYYGGRLLASTISGPTVTHEVAVEVQ
jgi:hypothetical protein